MDERTRSKLAAGASGSLVLGGKRYAVRQPKDEDMETLALFLGKQLRAAGEKLERAEGEKAAEFDARAGARLTEELSTVEGTRFLAWLLCDPKPPEKALAEHVHPYSYHDFFLALTRESGMADLGNGDGRPGS